MVVVGILGTTCLDSCLQYSDDDDVFERLGKRDGEEEGGKTRKVLTEKKEHTTSLNTV